MAEIIDSVGTAEKLVSFKNNGASKLALSGSGAILDASGVNRAIFNSAAKTIVDGAATALFSVPVAQGTSVGGMISFLVQASDGTDHQAIAGLATFASVNKAGTLTNTITNLTTTNASAVSAGTLTLAFTMAEDAADVVTIKLQPTGSLTETSYTVTYTMLPAVGAVTIL
jgi:hypothetical protein